jgi:hypothetical protein
MHGAFADESMWASVISELQAARIDVVAVASPLRSLASMLERTPGPRSSPRHLSGQT